MSETPFLDAWNTLIHLRCKRAATDLLADLFTALAGDGPHHPALRRDLLTILGDEDGARLDEWRKAFESDPVAFRDMADQRVFDSRASL